MCATACALDQPQPGSILGCAAIQVWGVALPCCFARQVQACHGKLAEAAARGRGPFRSEPRYLLSRDAQASSGTGFVPTLAARATFGADRGNSPARFTSLCYLTAAGSLLAARHQGALHALAAACFEIVQLNAERSCYRQLSHSELQRLQDALLPHRQTHVGACRGKADGTCTADAEV